MTFKTGLLTAATCLLMATAAQAIPVSGQISLQGYGAAIGSSGMAASTGIDFVSGPTGSLNTSSSAPVAGSIASFGSGTGSFSGFGCATGSCGSIKDLLSYNTGPISTFLTLSDGSKTMTFDLASLTVTSRDMADNTITLSATGVINETGYEATAGTFTLQATGNSITSFSAQTTAIPEPASLALLGGTLAIAGLIRRKKA